jgi:hypothetical protein
VKHLSGATLGRLWELVAFDGAADSRLGGPEGEV